MIFRKSKTTQEAKPNDAASAFPRSEEEFDPVEAYQMPLLEHLRELRTRLVISLVATAVGVAACFSYTDIIWNFLVAPMNEALVASEKGKMVIIAPLEGFLTYLKVSLVAGLGIASPVISYQIWRFVAPALYPKEKRLVVPLMIASTLLFFLGAAFCYTVIFQFAFPFFIEITADDVQANLSIAAYLGLVTRLLVAFGVCFQLPVIVFFLARIGLIDARDMVVFFRYGVVGIFVLSALLTPPDVLSQMLMAAPMIVLYIIGIAVAWLFTTKERDPEDEASAS
ncbi:MAG: twin-arginine translocase subunit TatC [Deltaproteobacteria bacterium]|nr:twin-arginine translocase subunit TatC [Deltaproteobacteria bacterium]HCH66475.1 twin-arginine translocase subunit TatC [Deltaproteobacteria bacterium]